MKPAIFIMVLTAWLMHSAEALQNDTQEALLVDIEDDIKGNEVPEEKPQEESASEEISGEEQSLAACIELTNWKLHEGKKEIVRFFPQTLSARKDKLISLMVKKCLESIPTKTAENILETESKSEYSKLNEHVQLNYLQLKPIINWTISEEEQRLLSEYRESYPKSSPEIDSEANDLVKQYNKPLVLDEFEQKLLKYIKRLYARIEFSKARLSACHIMAKKRTNKDIVKIVDIEDTLKITVNYMPKIQAIMTTEFCEEYHF